MCWGARLHPDFSISTLQVLLSFCHEGVTEMRNGRACVRGAAGDSSGCIPGDERAANHKFPLPLEEGVRRGKSEKGVRLIFHIVK